MYQIIGTYQGEKEVIDEFDTRLEAAAMVKEYAMAFGAGWTFRIRHSN